LKKRDLLLVWRLTSAGAGYYDLGNFDLSFILSQSEGWKIRVVKLLTFIIDSLKNWGLQAALEDRDDLSLMGNGNFFGLFIRQGPGLF
jgi:lipoate-protein ligase A